jgi:hypothetical protein
MMNKTYLTGSVTAVIATVGLIAGTVSPAAAQDADTTEPSSSTAPTESSTPRSTGSAPEDSTCVDVFALGVQGTGQSSPDSPRDMDTGFLGQVFSSINAELNKDGVSEVTSFDREYIPYESSMGGIGVNGMTPTKSTAYDESVTGGVDELTRRAAEILEQCPSTRIVPVGYSQGADVVDKFLYNVGNGNSVVPADAVAAGAVFGSPRRSQGMELIPGGGATPSAPQGFDDEAVAHLPKLTAPPAEGAGMLPTAEHVTDYGALAGEVGQFCITGDLVCDMPADSPIARTVAKVGSDLDISSGDPFKILGDLGDAFALTPIQTAADVVNEDIQGESLETVRIEPKKSISQRLEDATADPIDSSDAADESSDSSAESTESVPDNQRESTGILPGVDESIAGDVVGGLGEMAGDAVGQGLAASGADAGVQATAQDAMAAITKLGVLGMNSAVTIAKKSITPETIAQVAAVGLANPAAGLAVLGTKVAATATEVLAPVGMQAAGAVFDYATKEVEDNDGLIQMATDVTYWKHWQNHTAYGSTPVTDDGTAATDYVAAWILGLSAAKKDTEDITGVEVPTSTSASTDATAGDASGSSSTSETSAASSASSTTSEQRDGEDTSSSTTTSEPVESADTTDSAAESTDDAVDRD